MNHISLSECQFEYFVNVEKLFLLPKIWLYDKIKEESSFHSWKQYRLKISYVSKCKNWAQITDNSVKY